MANTDSILKAKSWILNKIDTESWLPGETLPNVATIAKQLEIDTEDVQPAIDELIVEQVLTQNYAEGIKVKSTHQFFYPLNQLFSISKMIEKEGYTAGTVFVNLDERPSTARDSKLLNITAGSPVTLIERIRTANGEPVVFCLDKVSAQHLTCSAYQSNDLSILKAIEINTDKRIAYARTEIESIGYEPYVSEALNASPHDALMLLKQIHYDTEDRPVLYSLNYFKSSLVKFRAVRNRIDD